MARYTTRIEADASKYPVLLSNGNLKEEGQLEGGRHYAVWEVRVPACQMSCLLMMPAFNRADRYARAFAHAMWCICHCFVYA
jgi:aminopeptidase N